MHFDEGITISEFARRWEVHRNTVRSWCRKGHLRTVRRKNAGGYRTLIIPVTLTEIGNLPDSHPLKRHVRRLEVAMIDRLNKTVGRSAAGFADRYHRAAFFCYVLVNSAPYKHGTVAPELEWRAGRPKWDGAKGPAALVGDKERWPFALTWAQMEELGGKQLMEATTLDSALRIMVRKAVEKAGMEFTSENQIRELLTHFEKAYERNEGARYLDLVSCLHLRGESVAAIADAAGVSRQTVYNYWKRYPILGSLFGFTSGRRRPERIPRHAVGRYQLKDASQDESDEEGFDFDDEK